MRKIDSTLKRYLPSLIFDVLTIFAFSSLHQNTSAMPKTFKQKFREEWIKHPELNDWIVEDLSNSKKALCKYCKCGLSCKLHDLLVHAKTKRWAVYFSPGLPLGLAGINSIT